MEIVKHECIVINFKQIKQNIRVSDKLFFNEIVFCRSIICEYIWSHMYKHVFLVKYGQIFSKFNVFKFF